MEDDDDSDEEPSNKKSKSEILTFSFTSLPENQLDDDKFTKWLKKNGGKKIEIESMRANWRRGKAFVDISSDFKEKVLALNGTSFNGYDIEVEVDTRGPPEQSQSRGGGGDR